MERVGKRLGEMDADALAELFAVSRMLSLHEVKPPSEQKTRLAAALLEILTNEETPERLQDAAEEFVSESNGPIAERWTLPGALPALEHLLTFVQ